MLDERVGMPLEPHKRLSAREALAGKRSGSPDRVPQKNAPGTVWRPSRGRDDTKGNPRACTRGFYSIHQRRSLCGAHTPA
jgi:hypothetical protein